MENKVPLIDKEFGLSQLSGNEALLTKMINKFAAEFSDVPAAVMAHIKEGDMREAKMKVHTTKGISGNLGLSAIFQCSKKLDQELKEQIVNDETLTAFSTLMASTCAEINDMGSPQNTSADTADSDSEHDAYKHKLIEKLNAHEFITESELDAWSPHLKIDAKSLANIKDAIDSLDYEKALQLLKG